MKHQDLAAVTKPKAETDDTAEMKSGRDFGDQNDPEMNAILDKMFKGGEFVSLDEYKKTKKSSGKKGHHNKKNMKKTEKAPAAAKQKKPKDAAAEYFNVETDPVNEDSSISSLMQAK